MAKSLPSLVELRISVEEQVCDQRDFCLHAPLKQLTSS